MYQLKTTYTYDISIKKSKHGLAAPSLSLTHTNYDISLFCNQILSHNEFNDLLNKVCKTGNKL